MMSAKVNNITAKRECIQETIDGLPRASDPTFTKVKHTTASSMLTVLNINQSVDGSTSRA